MKSQALQEPHHQADAVGAGEFQVGRRWQFWVDLDDLLQQNRYGANWVPEEDGKFGVGLPFSAEMIEGLYIFNDTSYLF